MPQHTLLDFNNYWIVGTYKGKKYAYRNNSNMKNSFEESNVCVVKKISVSTRCGFFYTGSYYYFYNNKT